MGLSSRQVKGKHKSHVNHEQDLERHCSKRQTNGPEAHKKMPHVSDRQEIQTQTTVRCRLTSIRLAVTKTAATARKRGLVRTWRSRSLRTQTRGCQTVQQQECRGPQNTRSRAIYTPLIPPVGAHPQDPRAGTPTRVCTVFTAAWLRAWDRTRAPSTDEGMKGRVSCSLERRDRLPPATARSGPKA